MQTQTRAEEGKGQGELKAARLSCLAATFGVVVAGHTAVTSAPPRPGKHHRHMARGRPDEMPKQTTPFRHRQGQQGWGLPAGSKRLASLGGKGSREGGLDTDRCPEGVCQQNARDVTIPPDPTPDLVVVQAHILRVFKIFLDVPPRPKGLHHLVQRGGRWSEDEVVGEVLRIAHAPTRA